MSSTALPTTDPLHAFIAGAFVARTPHPIPLVATSFDVILDAGVAIVTMMRRFRNAETTSIEATITFPVPVHATMFNLTARIGDRTLTARARGRSVARADYEGAVDAGKTAVLHEEVLRGVHMLSVAHVPPGAEIEVSSTWALTLTNIDGRAHLRIPLTVGDIYGRSGLSDSDDLAHGGRADMVQLTVDCRDGVASLSGSELSGGRASVPLNAPIDLAVANWTPRDLSGIAADGHAVSLRVEPAPGADRELDVAVLVDHSGSMGSACSADDRCTKHEAVARGLRTIARAITAADTIDLWEFDDSLDHVGSTAEPREERRQHEEGDVLLALVRQFRSPRGGTEIGHALTGVMERSRVRDLLLITDGMSHALDVQMLARSGRRVAVVLVGEESLEANVGHLAALTGGEIFVASGSDLTSVLIEALRSLRVPYTAPAPVSGRADHVTVRRAGMTITATWRDGAATSGALEARGVAALAASLVLPALSQESAAALAEAEGLVTHLTSLLLIDEAGAAQQTVPAMRKVLLPSPRTQGGVVTSRARAFAAAPEHLQRAVASGRASAMRGLPVGKRSSRNDLRRWLGLGQAELTPEVPDEDLSRIARLIDWDRAPQELQAGDLSGIAAPAAHAIREAAAKTEVAALAGTLGLDPVVLVIGLLAHAVRAHRTAARIARAIFGGEPPAAAVTLARTLHIAPEAA
jgi:Vault protein inter-alpha-trypsin domain